MKKSDESIVAREIGRYARQLAGIIELNSETDWFPGTSELILRLAELAKQLSLSPPITRDTDEDGHESVTLCYPYGDAAQRILIGQKFADVFGEARHNQALRDARTEAIRILRAWEIVFGVAANVETDLLTQRAKLDGLPAEAVESLRTFAHPLDWRDVEAAAFVYCEAYGLPKTVIGTPTYIDFAKLERWIDHRHAEACKSAGIEPGVMIPAEDPRYKLSKQIDADYQRELNALHGFLPPSTPTPAGWEGITPAEEIKTLGQLREYLQARLKSFRETGIGPHLDIFARHALEDAQDAWRNAWRVFDHLGIVDRPDRGDDPKTAEAAERKLSEMILWLRTAATTDSAINAAGVEARVKLDIARDPQAPAATPRLTVVLQPPQAVLDGTAFALKPDGAVLIDALLKANGDWIAGRKLDMRADRVRNNLPQELRDLVESSPGKGFRIPRR